MLNDSRFQDKSAEDIYAELMKEKRQKQPQAQSPNQPQSKPGKPGQTGQSGNGKPQAGNQPSQGQSGKPSPGNVGGIRKAAGPAKAAEAKAKVQTEKALQIANSMRGTLSADTELMIRKGLQPRFDWREVLHRFFREITNSDYSFATPNKRFAHTGIILPSLRAQSMGRIVLAIDTSGSVSTAEVSAMVAEMQACLEAYAENGLSQPLTVIYCDSEIRAVETLQSGDVAKPVGGGGTSFIPVFKHVSDLDGAACLVYLTDGYGDSPAALEPFAPCYPVLWGLIRDNASFAPPFGEVFRFDVHA